MELCWNSEHGPIPVNAEFRSDAVRWVLVDRNGYEVEIGQLVYANDETGEIWTFALDHADKSGACLNCMPVLMKARLGAGAFTLKRIGAGTCDAP